MTRQVIVNVRGPNAAGKTTLVRRFATGPQYTWPMTGPDGKLIQVPFHQQNVPGLAFAVTFIGPYDERKYSGCDAIKSADVICDAIRTATIQGAHVIFEGFRVSKSWERFASLRNELMRGQGLNRRWLWALLDADHALVCERAEARREPGARPVDRDELAAVCRQMNNTRTKAKAAFPRETLVMNPRHEPEELYTELLLRMRQEEQG